MDAALTAVSEAFESDLPERFVMPIDPVSGRPGTLIVQLPEPVDSDPAWDRLIQAEKILLDEAPALGERTHVREPCRIRDYSGRQSLGLGWCSCRSRGAELVVPVELPAKGLH